MGTISSSGLIHVRGCDDLVETNWVKMSQRGLCIAQINCSNTAVCGTELFKLLCFF